MTLQEFKAWFEGFTESMEKAPTAKQWDRIKKRVKEIDGTAVTERIFVDRYWPPYRRWNDWPSYTTCGTVGNYNASWQNLQGSCNAQSLQGGSLQGASLQGGSLQGFQSGAAMYALGRADLESLSS